MTVPLPFSRLPGATCVPEILFLRHSADSSRFHVSRGASFAPRRKRGRFRPLAAGHYELKVSSRAFGWRVPDLADY
jgi:hypothetical protein